MHDPPGPISKKILTPSQKIKPVIGDENYVEGQDVQAGHEVGFGPEALGRQEQEFPRARRSPDNQDEQYRDDQEVSDCVDKAEFENRQDETALKRQRNDAREK